MLTRDREREREKRGNELDYRTICWWLCQGRNPLKDGPLESVVKVEMVMNDQDNDIEPGASRLFRCDSVDIHEHVVNGRSAERE